MKFLVFGIFLLVGGILAQEVCLKTSVDDDSEECSYPARPVSKNDLENLIIFCKISRNIFPFQPRSSVVRNNGFKDGLPHLEMQDSSFMYQFNLKFSECEKGIKARADQFFWLTKVDTKFANRRLVGREFSADDKERNNTCIGIVEKIMDKINFTPVHRDDFLNQPKEPYGYDFLVLRIPLQQTFNVTSVESSIEELENTQEVGYFSYYNPSEYDQVVEVFLDTQHSVGYYFESPKWARTIRVVNDQNNQIHYKGLFDDFEHIYEKTSYNITVLANTAVTARIVGKMVQIESEVTAVKSNLFSKYASVHESASNVTGRKIEYLLKDFHLEDVQVHHTSEVLVLSYTTIYVALLCLGVVLLAGVVVFIVRVAIRRFRGTRNSSVPYQTLQADS